MTSRRPPAAPPAAAPAATPPFVTDGEPRHLRAPRRHRYRVLVGIVGLGLLLALAGVVGPGLADTLAEGRQATARQQLQQIVDGLRRYSHDTLTLPTGVQGRTDVSWLHGPGELPLDNPFDDGGRTRPLADALLNDTMGGLGWSGPYIDELTADPWGRAYLVNVDGLVNGRERALALCAGPDGVVSTAPTAPKAGGDDIILALD